MAINVPINPSQDDMNRKFARQYVEANTQEELDQMAEDWDLSVEEIFDIMDLHPEYMDLLEDEVDPMASDVDNDVNKADGAMNLSGAKVSENEDEGMLTIKGPMDKTHLKDKETNIEPITDRKVVSYVDDKIVDYIKPTPTTWTPQRGSDNSFLTKEQSDLLKGNKKPMNFSGVEIEEEEEKVDRSRFAGKKQHPMHFTHEIDDFHDEEDVSLDSEPETPEVPIIEPEVPIIDKSGKGIKVKKKKEERPGWHKQPGANFWTINSKSPYWKTEKGGREAEKLWGSRPSWVKQR